MKCEKTEIVNRCKTALICFASMLCLALAFSLGCLYQVKEDEKLLQFTLGIISQQQTHTQVLMGRLESLSIQP